MKNKVIIILLIALLIFLCSCNNHDKASFEDYIEFIPTQALIGLNTGVNNNIGKSLSFFIKINNNEVDNETLMNNIKKEVHSVQLLSNDEIILNSAKKDWYLSTINNTAYLNLVIPIKEYAISEDTYIDSVRFNNDQKYTYSIGKYHLYLHKISNVKELAVVESPIQPYSLPNAGEKAHISYKIMTAVKRQSEPLNFTINIPDEFKKYFNIINITSTYDKTTTDYMYKEYKKFTSEEELKYFCVYDVTLSYTVDSNTNVIFQPVITAEINGEPVYCVSEYPLILFYEN